LASPTRARAAGPTHRRPYTHLYAETGSREHLVEAIRATGTLTMVLGATGLLTRYGRSFKGYPGDYAKMQSFWGWAGRIGVALLALGALLVVVSAL
jgi:hypothetical protein